MVLEYAHLHKNPKKMPSFVGYVGNYSSTMEHLGIGKSQEIVIYIGILGVPNCWKCQLPGFLNSIFRRIIRPGSTPQNPRLVQHGAGI